MKKDNYDIAIIGGGMTGMSLAIALARENISVVLVERGALPDQLESTFDGRVSAIALGSQHILNNIGAWEGMAPHAEPILDIRVSDGDTPFFLHYDHNEVSAAPFGFIIENRYIRYALQETARRQKMLTLKDKTSVQSISHYEGGVTVKTNAGDINCRLLIGADGKQSQIRNLANMNTVEWKYKQTAIVCTIRHDKPHNGLAQERFLPAGPFAVLPMTDNRSSLVWVEPNDRSGIYLELPDDEFVQEIRERVGDYLGEIRVEGKRFSYPLSLLHAQTYIGDRLALVGDAAHAIHPIAGQGVNLGFRDVAVLHELITERKNLGLDIGGAELLAHYQRWRRFDNVTMLTVTDGLNRLFSNNIVPIRLARNVGLWAVGKLSPVKRYFMKHAMGISGDVPKLAKKRA